MTTLTGKGVCGGVAFGKIQFYKRSAGQTERRSIDDTEAEIKRFEAARGQAVAELALLYTKATKEVGEENSLLFQIHQMMLEDLDYCESITNLIRKEKVNAEYAVSQTAKNFAEMFSSMDDEYMRGRADDVKDVSQRVLGILSGHVNQGVISDAPVIVAADDLAPSETIQLDKSKILAFVTAGGSANSHTAILARTMGIPAIIGVGSALNEQIDGKEAVVDGFSGELYLEPDEATSSRLRMKKREHREQKALLEGYKGKKSVTKSGQEILLYANIGNPSDLDAVLANDAEGVGLFRSEFLYLDSNNYPTEEEQFAAYKKVAEQLGGKRVVIRTLDIGADKQVDYFKLPKEENPAMGMRAIRICLTRPDIFKTQLRAIYRASAFGKIGIMFPMITSVKEVRDCKRIASEVREELTKENIPFAADVELGIMIETPAAAIISDQLAKEVDFFSVGTNDLTQYTLAMDRQNQSISEFCDTHHEAILRLIAYSAKNAHEAGIWIGICGELGADESLTEAYLQMGIDELSVTPPAILPLRAKICSL